ncbi:MAG: ABC transporter substrate-binding protein [Nevskiales bacterium]
MSNNLTRRMATSGLAALGASALLPRPTLADTAALEEAARKEGTLTWYIAQVDGETAELMGRAFTARYPGVKVSVIRTTGQVAYERLLQDLKNNAPQCDVFSTTDIAHMPALKKRNEIARYVPENAAAMAPAFQGLGEDGLYYPTTSTLMVIIYNTQRVKPEEAPKNWTDLLDPKWKGRVAFGHPAFSGYVGCWTLQMRSLYGWKFFDQLAKNNPRIGRSGNDPITLLNAGECVTGLGPLATTLLSAEKGNPIAAQYPTDGALLCIGPSAVMARAPHPNAARLFQNWLLSQEFAQVCANTYVTPVRDDVTFKPGAKPLSEVKILRETTQEIDKGVPEVIEQWRDTFS